VPEVVAAPLDSTELLPITVCVSDWVDVLPPLSLACTVKLHVCGVEGVPERIPVPLPSESPLHRVPAVTLQVTGAWQPEVPIACEYTVPTVPAGRVVVVIEQALPLKFTVISPP
jgi:hypothetical protein